MPLAAGSRLGVYEVTSLLGAGGMGEVYKARDTRLDRTVAIKVMPPDVAADPQFRARFDREARTISQLQHPHICTLYDVGEVDGTAFLVMELLQGQTLSDRLKKGALPLDEALKIAIDVADALGAAHREGITHRDLKPANIMLTKSGAKLLDFGLAKAAAPVVSVRTTSTRQSATTHLTGPGTILGTLHYMSPEQIEGHEADARSDIWALGCLLYEMLTGVPAFHGESSAGVIGAILKDRPLPLRPKNPAISATLDHLVSRCLEKDLEGRWQHATDVAHELRWAFSESAVRPTANGRRAAVFGLRAVIGVVAVLAALAAGALMRRPASVAPRALVTRAVLDLPAFSLNGARLANLVAFSPDGTSLVYVGSREGRTQLYWRRLDLFEASPIGGTEDGTEPFFSPDGQAVGFFARGKLKTIRLDGSAATTLADAPNPFGGTWTTADVIAFAPSTGGLMRVPAHGGEVTRLTELPPAGAVRHSWPTATADGNTVLFTVSVTTLNAHIDAVSLRDGRVQTVVASGGSPYVIDEGVLVYTDSLSGALTAIRFDPQRATTIGEPRVAVEGVMASAQVSQFSVSRTGSLVYVPNASLSERSLVWVGRSGQTTQAASSRMAYGSPRIAPDGRRIAFLTYDGLNPRDVWVYDPQSLVVTRLTTEGRTNTVPIWSPDGRSVVFSSVRDASAGRQNLFSVPSDASGPAERLTDSDHIQIPLTWAPDGHTLVYAEIRPETQYDIFAIDLTDRSIRTIVASPGNDIGASVSPDGRYIAYSSDETGQSEVYVQSFPTRGRRWRVSSDGGTEPAWSNRDELFYRAGDRMMAVEATTAAGGLSLGTAQALFEGRFERTILTPGIRMYDVTADGQRFLMVKAMTSTAPSQLRLVANWITELRGAFADPH